MPWDDIAAVKTGLFTERRESHHGMHHPGERRPVRLHLRTMLPEGQVLRMHRLPPSERGTPRMPVSPGDRADVRSLPGSVYPERRTLTRSVPARSYGRDEP